MPAGSPPIALICEDDTTLARALADTATGLYGLRIAATVSSGSDAIEAAERLQPDLIVIDLALAGERGLAIIGALHEVAPESSVAIVVPAGFAGLRDEAIAAGASTLIVSSDLRPLRHSMEGIIGGSCQDTCAECGTQGVQRALNHQLN